MPAKQRRARPAVGLVEKHPGVRNLWNIKTCYHTYKHGGVLLTISSLEAQNKVVESRYRKKGEIDSLPS